MNALHHSKRHHNIETVTVVWLTVKLKLTDACSIRRILRSILCCMMVVVYCAWNCRSF